MFFNPAPLFHRVPLIRDEVIRGAPLYGAVTDLLYYVEEITGSLVVDMVYARGVLLLKAKSSAKCVRLRAWNSLCIGYRGMASLNPVVPVRAVITNGPTFFISSFLDTL